MRIYRADPDQPNGRGVIVIQEAFGVNAHIEDVTRRFAAEGYVAVAPDLFHRAGGGTAPYDDFTKVMPLFEGVSDEGIVADVDEAIAALAEAGVPAEKVGIVGFCFGGRVTFLVAAERRIGAASGFYGGGIASAGYLPFPALIERAGELKTPWLGLFGDQDTGIPVDDVETLRDALDTKAPVATEVVHYPDAEHGFHCNERPAYHAESAADAWARTLAWFDKHLG